jgi:hypothetical protein
MLPDLLVIGLACWRISSLVVGEDGPWFVFDRIRKLVRAGDYNNVPPPDRRWYIGIFECIWCCSMWVGIGYAVIYLVNPWLALAFSLPFSISALAIIYNTVLERLQS